MGKLYFITGNDGQLREKVCCEILKWSEAEQISPLQSYPCPNDEAPNFYLYDYLGQGGKEQFAQLAEQLGEETIECIYLRSANETEETLIKDGIYQSYDPYTDLAQCLQEIVETVFNGYQKTKYDFAAVFQAEQAQKEAALQQEEKTKKKVFFRKNIKPVVVIAVWALIVCLITVGIFQGATNRTTSENKGGNLITVTKPEKTPDKTSDRTPTTAPTTTPVPLQQKLFTRPMEDDYLLDLSKVVKRGDYLSYHINYTSAEQNYYDFFIGSGIDGVEGDYHVTSIDGKIGVLLLDSALWYFNGTGRREVSKSVSHCALSANGNYLFYLSNNVIYSLDTKNNTQEKLQTASGVQALVASSNGKYCAYLKGDGSVTIINRESKTTKTIAGFEYNVLYTLSNDGIWVCGKAYLDNQNYLLCSGTNGTIKWLTDEKTDCYIPFNGSNIIFEMMEQLWYSQSVVGGYPMHKLNGMDWKLLFTKENSLYEVADGIYMYDESAPFYAKIGDDLFQITYDSNREKYTTTPASPNLDYFIDNALLNDIQYIVSTKQDGEMLYVNHFEELCYYSPFGPFDEEDNRIEVFQGSQQVMDFSNVLDYAVAKDGTLYYSTALEKLGYVKMNTEFFTKKQVKESFPSAAYVKFEVNNAGVYVDLYTSPSDPTADLYFVQEDTCQLLGTEVEG